MQSIICRGCRRPLLEEHSIKNIFDDDSLIKSIDCNDPYNKKWYMKLYSGIELITGQKVTKDEKLPQNLCKVCFQNVEAYINFRFQLLRSRDILLSSSYQNTRVVTDTKFIETKNLLLLNTLIPKVDMNETIKKLPEVNLFQPEFCDSPLVSNTVMSTLISKAMPEDLINVDDCSTNLDVNGLHNENGSRNDALANRLQNDQENNNFNDSEGRFDNIITTNMNEYDKQFEHDIESEIDVCSGEDDDILELDVHKMKNETVEIQSSSESDIEVCDYEPTGKRGNYNTLSSTITF